MVKLEKVNKFFNKRKTVIPFILMNYINILCFCQEKLTMVKKILQFFFVNRFI